VIAAKLLSNNVLDAVFAMANDEEPHAYNNGSDYDPRREVLQSDEDDRDSAEAEDELDSRRLEREVRYIFIMKSLGSESH
jgi:hypothetical protein